MKIGGAEVVTGRDEHGPYLITRFEDGAELLARPEHNPEYEIRARRLGYDSAEACNDEHDPTHSALAVLLGLNASPTLYATAHGWPIAPDLWIAEEDAVKAIQAYKNALRRANLLPGA